MKRMKKCISIIVVFIMVVTMLPVIQTNKVKGAGVYYIYTIEDLYNINNDMSGTYYLMNDLDMSKATAKGGDWDYMGNGWEPIGSNGIYEGVAFKGTFYGNNHTIKGLNINLSNEPSGMNKGCYIGLFANNAGTIRDLNVMNASIYAKLNVSGHKISGGGIIAGVNSGWITYCITSGSISNNTSGQGGVVGGVAGENSNRINLCQNKARIYSNDNCGGIAGTTTSVNGVISKCFNEGEVSCGVNYGDAGGITGHLYEGGLIEESYNVGEVSRPYDPFFHSAGISVCDDNNVTIRRCYNSGDGGRYAIANLDNVCESCYYLDGSGLGRAGTKSLTKAQMKLQSMYSGFNFNTVWVIDDATEYKYPQLRDNRQDTLKVINKIEMYSQPDKLNYYIGDKLDLNGGSIMVYYANGSSEIMKLTEDMVSGYSSEKEGTQIITVSYRNFKVEFPVVVRKRPNIIGVNLLSEPTKTEFVKGTEFDFSGCQVQLAYDNGEIETIDVTVDMTSGGNINNTGKQTIKCTFGSQTVSFKITVVPIRLENIEFVSLPTKIEYIEGQAFTSKGMVVKANYNNGMSSVVEDYEMIGYESTPGTHTITVTYFGVSNTFDVYVREAKVKSIKVTKMPEKTEYIQGQTVDTEGMEVTAYYDNGTEKKITDFDVEKIGTETGFQTVEVSYGDIKTYISVMVIARQVEKITIKELPKQVNYIEETEFDPSGLIVTATFNDGVTEEVTDYALSNVTTKEIGEKTVSVLYGGKSTSFHINVVAKTLEKITIKKPEKVSYLLGEKFDNTGLIVTAWYNNDKSYVISDYTVSGYTGEIGSNTITVEYGGMTSNFYVTVHNLQSEWEVIIEPDCEHKGERIKRCTECGEIILKEEIDELGHTVVIDEKIEATCTETGLSEGSHCSTCNKVLKKQDVIPAKGHTPSETWSIINNPLCIDTGLQIRICKDCGEEIERKIIDAKGHKIVIDEAVPATCTESGLSEGSHCEVCHEIFDAQTVVEATGHVLDEEWTIIKEPTCTKAGEKVKYCTVCGKVVEKKIIEALGHSYKDYHSDNNATCTEDGTKTSKCERCDHTNTIIDEGSAIGHHIVLDEAVPATCTESGLTEGSHCDICNETIKKQTVVEPKGHRESEKWVLVQEATCTEKGVEVIRCVECDEVLDTRKIEAKGHHIVIDKEVPATCTETGLTEGSHCSICNEIIKKQELIRATGHTIVTKNAVSPSYIKIGYTGDGVCDKCGETISKGKEIAKLILDTPKVSLKSKNGKLKAKVNKIKGVKGYEYRIKVGKKWKKYVTTKTTCTFRKLKKGKKYSVKVRAYNIENGIKYYSSWSKKKKRIK